MRLSALLLLAAPLAAHAYRMQDVPADTAKRVRISLPVHLPEESYDNDVDLEAARNARFQLSGFESPRDPTAITRAVIQLHGLARDAWWYFDLTQQALERATRRKNRTDGEKLLTEGQVMIFAPFFLNDQDNAATPNNRTLQWHGSQWAYGADTRSPSTFLDASGVSHPAPGVSSFEAVDAAVAHYANKTRFPNIESIVVAGHSLGAQMVQRYALIGAVPSRDVPVHFVIANPSSYAYLDSVRPNSTANCASTYDAWKFGLGSYTQRYLSSFMSESLDSTKDVEDVRRRYTRERKVHYLYGLADHEVGDSRCEAFAQGDNHLMRGQLYMEHLDRILAGEQGSHTVDYVPGVKHEPYKMFASAAGLRHLFTSNDAGEPAGVGFNDKARSFYPARLSGAQQVAEAQASLFRAIFAAIPPLR